MLSKPRIEAFKELLRLAIFFLLSWIVAATLTQVNVIPVLYQLHVGPLVYTIPAQALVVSLLTLLGRYSDKYVFERSKETAKFGSNEPNGLLPF
jgi:hypothetical protein